MLERVWRKENPPTLLVGMYTGTATMETVWRFPKKLKIELLYDPAIPLLGIYPEKTIIQKDACTQCSLSTIYNIQTMKATKCPSTGEWIKKTCTYIQWNISQP